MDNNALLKIEKYIEIDLRAMRVSRKLGLREACRLFKIDASNYSKMERGILPLNEETYEKILSQLMIIDNVHPLNLVDKIS